MAAVLELVAGSYEQVVCGYRVKTGDDVSAKSLSNFIYDIHALLDNRRESTISNCPDDLTSGMF